MSHHNTRSNCESEQCELIRKSLTHLHQNAPDKHDNCNHHCESTLITSPPSNTTNKSSHSSSLSTSQFTNIQNNPLQTSASPANYINAGDIKSKLQSISIQDGQYVSSYCDVPNIPSFESQPMTKNSHPIQLTEEEVETHHGHQPADELHTKKISHYTNNISCRNSQSDESLPLPHQLECLTQACMRSSDKQNTNILPLPTKEPPPTRQSSLLSSQETQLPLVDVKNSNTKFIINAETIQNDINHYRHFDPYQVDEKNDHCDVHSLPRTRKLAYKRENIPPQTVEILPFQQPPSPAPSRTYPPLVTLIGISTFIIVALILSLFVQLHTQLFLSPQQPYGPLNFEESLPVNRHFTPFGPQVVSADVLISQPYPQHSHATFPSESSYQYHHNQDQISSTYIKKSTGFGIHNIDTHEIDYISPEELTDYNSNKINHDKQTIQICYYNPDEPSIYIKPDQSEAHNLSQDQYNIPYHNQQIHPTQKQKLYYQLSRLFLIAGLCTSFYIITAWVANQIITFQLRHNYISTVQQQVPQLPQQHDPQLPLDNKDEQTHHPIIQKPPTLNDEDDTKLDDYKAIRRSLR